MATEAPQAGKPTTAKVLPNRCVPTKDMVETMRCNLLRDTELPTSVIANTDMVEANFLFPRSDSEAPIIENSSTESAAPKRGTARNANAEAMQKLATTEIDAPTWTIPPIDKADAKL
jgi:hypothetical protein